VMGGSALTVYWGRWWKRQKDYFDPGTRHRKRLA
jgi:hypothetical protein